MQLGLSLGDNHHNGVGNAGNKSFCSYRLGYGVPGYTGFVPMEENLAIPSKEAGSERAALPLRSSEGLPGDGGTIKKPGSTFKEHFSITPAEFAEGTQPNPLWDIKGKRPVGDPPFIRRPPETFERTFIGKSTFADSYKGAHTSKDYPEDVTKVGQLRPPGTTTPTALSPFYTTEYMQKSEEGNVNMATKKVLPPGPEAKERANRDMTGVNLRIPELRTSYRDTFGKFGVDPITKTPKDASQINFLASTAENFQGTTKASYHPPGYSGFIPETGRNPLATQQGSCTDPRESTKNFELQILFQYPHQVPGYGGYRPQTAINDVGPVRNEASTTTGRNMIAGTGGFQPGDLGLSMGTLAETAPQRSVFGKSGSLNKTAFSHESMSGALSDNGRHDAEMYYKTVRPMEGRSVAIIKQGHWSQLY